MSCSGGFDTTVEPSGAGVGSRDSVISAAFSEQKVVGSIPMIGDFLDIRPCKKTVSACLVNGVQQDTLTVKPERSTRTVASREVKKTRETRRVRVRPASLVKHS